MGVPLVPEFVVAQPYGFERIFYDGMVRQSLGITGSDRNGKLIEIVEEVICGCIVPQNHSMHPPISFER